MKGYWVSPSLMLGMEPWGLSILGKCFTSVIPPAWVLGIFSSAKKLCTFQMQRNFASVEIILQFCPLLY